MSKHTVIVSNIGTVVDKAPYKKAAAAFREYRRQSRCCIGRAAGEPVYWMVDGEVYKEYIPKAKIDDD